MAAQFVALAGGGHRLRLALLASARFGGMRSDRRRRLGRRLAYPTAAPSSAESGLTIPREPAEIIYAVAPGLCAPSPEVAEIGRGTRPVASPSVGGVEVVK